MARTRLAVGQIEATVVLHAILPGPSRALFTTRLGGHSCGPFHSLNLDGRSEDDPLAVASNREQMSLAVGRRLVSPLQVHGLRVAGAAEYVEGRPDSPCDGLTLHPEIDKGLAPLLLFADCVPLVLCGEVDMAVVHGGWRGIVGGIVNQAGRSMMSPPATAVIGPSIGPCCFTVGEEVAGAFAARFGSDVVLPAGVDGGSPRVDLWAAITAALGEMGVPSGQVVNPRLCTACNADLFYSYRKEGPVTGRHGCLAWFADR